MMDFDTRPNGIIYVLHTSWLPRIELPPEIVLIGKTRGGVVYCPPKNWMGAFRKPPTMPKIDFIKYFASPLKLMRLWPQCRCGYNTMVNGRCCRCGIKEFKEDYDLAPRVPFTE